LSLIPLHFRKIIFANTVKDLDDFSHHFLKKSAGKCH
jgi:hypothetical protein